MTVRQFRRQFRVQGEFEREVIESLTELRTLHEGTNSRLDILNGKTARNVQDIEDLKQDRAAREAVTKEREKEQTWSRIKALLYPFLCILGGAAAPHWNEIVKVLKP